MVIQNLGFLFLGTHGILEPEYSWTKTTDWSNYDGDDGSDKDVAEDPKISNPTSNSEHVDNTSWCSYKNCIPETRNIDCLCCKEELSINDEKFEGKGVNFSFIALNCWKDVEKCKEP